MDVSNIEPNQNIIYITEEDHRSEWSYDATKEFLKIYDEKSDMLDTGIISTQKKLWQLTSTEMMKNGFYYTAAQCENKWKALKRSYRAKIERMQRFGSSKKDSPFEFEVAEILSKRLNDNFTRSYSDKIHKLKKEELLFKMNLNEPPGFTKDKTAASDANYSNVKAVLEGDVESPELESEADMTTYTVIQDNSQNVLIEEISDLKSILVKHNKINMHNSRQTVEVHEKILNCLERAVEGQAEARQVEEMKAKQQEEIVQQMKLQNALLQKLLEKLG